VKIGCERAVLYTVPRRVCLKPGVVGREGGRGGGCCLSEMLEHLVLVVDLCDADCLDSRVVVLTFSFFVDGFADVWPLGD
jgi:hypothetical protein